MSSKPWDEQAKNKSNLLHDETPIIYTNTSTVNIRNEKKSISHKKEIRTEEGNLGDAKVTETNFNINVTGNDLLFPSKDQTGSLSKPTTETATLRGKDREAKIKTGNKPTPKVATDTPHRLDNSIVKIVTLSTAMVSKTTTLKR